MFNIFSKMNLGLKIALSFIFVLIIALTCGILVGKHSSFSYVFWGILTAIISSIVAGWYINRSITDSVNKVLMHLSEAASNLISTSGELTASGHRLAEGSTEQAASIQETSATLEESASMIHQTTQNTREADILAKQTTNAADKGNSEMQYMLESMKELKNSSSEISKIIKVIDEIAFQTNILSLNAAVEAARAGDAGKGFAVVAEEVRNLAQRSAQAAKDTAAIIESNIDLSQKCLGITEQVSSSLIEITDETHKVSELLEEISTASQEQEIGIGQINQAISQMEQVLQANAATAQESASSAEQLAVYSETLKQIRLELVSLIEGGNSFQKQAINISSSNTRTVTTVTKIEKPEKKLNKLDKPSNINKLSKSVKTGHVPEVKVKKTEPNTKSVNPEDIIPLDDF